VRLLVLFLLAFLIVPNIVQAQETIGIKFFYAGGCPHCTTVSDFLDNLDDEYPIFVEKINANENPEEFLEIQKDYNVPTVMWSAVPKAFIGDFYCIGEKECTADLEDKVLELMESGNQTQSPSSGEDKNINIFQLLGLAAVDAVNPCALAVLIILLTAILTQFPGENNKVILAGLAFTTAIFVSYFTMGLLIVLGFKTVIAVTQLSSLWFYKILGAIAIILGILNLKDAYKPGAGGFIMEVPTSWRPRMKKMIRSTTSPVGAFLIGFIVSIFLLPCTSGPYFVAGGILAGFEWFQAFLPLLLYNLVFIFPMVVITLIVYFGFAKVEDLGGWRKKNVKKLHLIAGLILLGLGVAMLLGII